MADFGLSGTVKEDAEKMRGTHLTVDLPDRVDIPLMEPVAATFIYRQMAACARTC